MLLAATYRLERMLEGHINQLKGKRNYLMIEWDMLSDEMKKSKVRERYKEYSDITVDSEDAGASISMNMSAMGLK